jgi:integrase
MTKRAAKTKKPRVRRGLVKYPGGITYYYLLRWRKETKLRRGDTGCAGFEAAETWLTKEKEKWALAEQGLKRESPATLAGVLEDWLEVRGPVVSPKHRDQVEFTITNHFADLAHTPMAEISLLDLERAQTKLLATPAVLRRGDQVIGHRTRTEGGVNTSFKLLTVLWTWALNRDYPVGEMPKVAKLTPQEITEPVVWPELVPAFLHAVDFVPVRLDKDGNRAKWRPGKPTPRPEDQRLAIRLQLLLGLRENEALGFDWRWMDFRQEVYRPGETKNRKVREIAVEPDLLTRLRQRWEAQGSPAAGLAMFESPGVPRCEHYTAKIVGAAGRAVGLVGLHPHRLRATFATTLWEIGTPLTQIQQMMGHEDPETTLGYIVQRPKDQAQAVRKMAQVMGIGSCSTTVPPENAASSQNAK